MVAERVARPVRPLIHAQGPWGGPGAMSVTDMGPTKFDPDWQPDDGFLRVMEEVKAMTSGVSPGNKNMKEEEYKRFVQAAFPHWW